MERDSLNKIKGYLKSASQELIVSKMFFRDYSCPSHCGGCCPRFSLDYFEGPRWEKFKELYPEQIERFKPRIVDGVTVYTDPQDDHTNHHCRNLDMTNGRCKIHKSNPFTCEFELMRFVTHKSGKTYLMNRLFGRGWALTRIDGKKGALCQMLPFNKEKFLRDVELLKELEEIGIRLNIKNNLRKVLTYLTSIQFQ